jgi:hypothetical protein
MDKSKSKSKSISNKNLYATRNIIIEKKNLDDNLDDNLENNLEDNLDDNLDDNLEDNLEGDLYANLKILKNKIKIYKNNDLDSDSEESIDKLEKELDNKNVYPKNYGSKWSESDKKKLIKYLSNSQNKIFYDSDDIMINKLASKLKRSVGGVKAEIRRIIFEMYMDGSDPETISSELNIIYRDIKQIIKLHLEKESMNEINVLEKENLLLKLRIENIKLRNELKELIKQK